MTRSESSSHSFLITTISGPGTIYDDRYLDYKRSEGKRSIADDTMNLARLVPWFGAETPVSEITAERIADYARARAAERTKAKRPEAKRPVNAATRNRELATLRHALRLANEWGYIDKAEPSRNRDGRHSHRDAPRRDPGAGVGAR
jgi:hypothetical protein